MTESAIDNVNIIPTPSNFARAVNGKKIRTYTLKNKNGMKAIITNYGNRIVSLFVPDIIGRPIDVIENLKNIEAPVDTSCIIPCDLSKDLRNIVCDVTQ